MELITLTCETCGKPFTRRASYHRHITKSRNISHFFCSRQCKGKSEAKYLPEQIIPLYAAGQTLQEIAIQVGICPETVRRRLLENGVILRSRGAHMLGYRNPTRGKGHTPETKAKIRELTIRQFSNPEDRARAASTQRRVMAESGGATVSRIEDTVAVELDALGIEYQRQFGVRDPVTGRYCACVDFMLSDGRVLEVNGTFWHADPRAFPNGPIHSSQHRVARQYATKVEALQVQKIVLCECWEIDIRADSARAVAEALR